MSLGNGTLNLPLVSDNRELLFVQIRQRFQEVPIGGGFTINQQVVTVSLSGQQVEVRRTVNSASEARAAIPRRELLELISSSLDILQVSVDLLENRPPSTRPSTTRQTPSAGSSEVQ